MVISVNMSVTVNIVKDTLFPKITTDISGAKDTGTPIIYFMLVAAGLITWLIFCWTCSNRFNKRIQSGRSVIPQLALQSNVPPAMPEGQGQQISNTCIETRNTEETKTSQNRNMHIRISVKSQHIYDSVDDLVIDPHKPQEHVNTDGCQAACVQSTDDTDCDSCNANVTKRETYLNPYNTLKDKRDTKVHEYIEIPTTAED
ncbi:uncharacterized protein LOC127723653 [Mytilus californianus]|uniref:uncharacterized protein LOC127723653 n=1 Tax=Mytilus californianus TaxID=6549 RepID=UPI00224792A6|nr:uncharacterized protein LOC127723653 [Mytilus californianus]